LRLRLIPRARRLGARRLWAARRDQHRDRRHLSQQRAQERPVAGDRRRDGRRLAPRPPGRGAHTRCGGAHARSPRRPHRHLPARGLRPALPAARRRRARVPPRAERGNRGVRAPCMKARLAVLAGDGIGPEVIAEALRCLRRVAQIYGHELEVTELAFGGAPIDAEGDPLPDRTLRACLTSDAVLLGAVGGPEWSDPGQRLRPEQGLLRLRQSLGAFANLRPVKVHPALADASTLKPEVIQGVDLVFVRELTGGIYFGDRSRDADRATDVCTYTVAEVERITRVAARLAQTRRRRLTSIDKSNVLETSRLWREVSARVVAAEFPEVALEHMLVDSAAMLLRHSLHLSAEPAALERAVAGALADGARTPDIALAHVRALPTREVGDAVISRLQRPG